MCRIMPFLKAEALTMFFSAFATLVMMLLESPLQKNNFKRAFLTAS
jgi:hypothetical protein